MDNGANAYRRFLDGDEKAVVEIIDAYKDGLILFLNQFVHNIYTAEDLAQETFFRLMVKKPAFSGRSSFKTWLYAIGRNVAITYVRRNAKLIDTPPEDLEASLRDENDLEQNYIKEEEKRRLRVALEKLPPAQRQIIWLIYFEELPRGEAAIIMKKNARQIRSLLYRAKQSIKTELDEEVFTGEKHGTNGQ